MTMFSVISILINKMIFVIRIWFWFVWGRFVLVKFCSCVCLVLVFKCGDALVLVGAFWCLRVTWVLFGVGSFIFIIVFSCVFMVLLRFMGVVVVLGLR